MFKKAHFVKTALYEKDYPTFKDDKGTQLPEVAVVGRSNVGKSSLLNDFFQMPGLAKTAKRPGKTQGLNFFETDEGVIFVDLPGYGYAKVSHELKKEWAESLDHYLNSRETLKLVLLLLDSRHLPTNDDKAFMNWIRKREMSAIVVLTKIDKLKPNEREKQTKLIYKALRNPPVPYVHYSSVEHLGRKELIKEIVTCLS